MDHESSGVPLMQSQAQHYRDLCANPALRTSIQASFRITGLLDVGALISSVEAVVGRRDALRILFFERNAGAPFQRTFLVPPRARLVTCQRVRATSERQFSRYVNHVMASDMNRSWVPTDHPFLFRLLQYSEELHAFLADFSHIAMDAAGREIVLRDIWDAYSERVAPHANTPRGGNSGSFLAIAEREALIHRRASDTRDTSCHSSVILPPITQYVNSPSRKSPVRVAGGHRFSFTIQGGALQDFRRRVAAGSSTEFHWILAEFAATVFRLTPQDVIKISVPVDTRRVSERHVAGMFVVNVPVLIRRPVGEVDEGYVAQVGRAVISAIVACRRRPQSPSSASLGESGLRWGAWAATDLSVNYQKVAEVPADLAETGIRAERNVYHPRIAYSSNGLDLKVLSRAETLSLDAVLSERVFSSETVQKVACVLERRLTSLSHGINSCFELGGDHDGLVLTPLCDVEGRRVMLVDTKRVESALLRHPAVVSAQAEVVALDGERGGRATTLHGRVVVDGNVSEDQLRNQLLDAVTDDCFVLAPQRISISHVADNLPSNVPS